LRRWVDLGRAQAERLGVEAIPLVVRTRDEADDPEVAAQVTGAGLVYLSGGNPPYLAATLRHTKVWSAIREAWEGGAALAGCSAGAMALTTTVPHVRQRGRPDEEGLGVLPGWRVMPHFDRMRRWAKDLLDEGIASLADGQLLLGIDEDTALVHQDGAWTAHGRQAVHVFTHEGRETYRDGASVPLPPL
jgi:cyanophycinase-like exopeptidase